MLVLSDERTRAYDSSATVMARMTDVWPLTYLLRHVADKAIRMILAQTIKKLALLSTLPLMACSTVTTRTPEGDTVEMGEAEFSAYLEHVFRHHNKVVDYLMFTTGRSENEVSAAGTHLVEMEAKMAHACLPLNELVTESMLGHTPDFWTRMKLADAVPACELATRKVERLLPGDYDRTDKNDVD